MNGEFDIPHLLIYDVNLFRDYEGRYWYATRGPWGGDMELHSTNNASEAALNPDNRLRRAVRDKEGEWVKFKLVVTATELEALR